MSDRDHPEITHYDALAECSEELMQAGRDYDALVAAAQELLEAAEQHMFTGAVGHVALSQAAQALRTLLEKQ